MKTQTVPSSFTPTKHSRTGCSNQQENASPSSPLLGKKRKSPLLLHLRETRTSLHLVLRLKMKRSLLLLLFCRKRSPLLLHLQRNASLPRPSALIPCQKCAADIAQTRTARGNARERETLLKELCSSILTHCTAILEVGTTPSGASKCFTFSSLSLWDHHQMSAQESA